MIFSPESRQRMVDQLLIAEFPQIGKAFAAEQMHILNAAVFHVLHVDQLVFLRIISRRDIQAADDNSLLHQPIISYDNVQFTKQFCI